MKFHKGNALDSQRETKVDSTDLTASESARLPPLARPRCWPCLLFLTCVGAVFAFSGAADITSAIMMIGAGLALDLVRWTLHRRWLTQTYWTEQIGKALSDPAYVSRTRNLNRWWLISTTAIFLLHGTLWVALAPSESGARTSIFAHLYLEPDSILRISHIARSYMSELVGRGYPDRGHLWVEFVCESFTIYLTCVVIWILGWLKQATVLNLVARHKAISARVANLKPWSVIFAICGAFSVMGFLVVNNLATAHGVNQQVRAGLPTSSGFFMTYSIQMMFSCLMALWASSFSIPYCLDLAPLNEPP